MSRQQGVLLHLACVAIQAILNVYVTDIGLRTVLTTVLASAQMTMGIQSFSNNPDGSPALVSYRPQEVTTKLDVKDYKDSPEAKIEAKLEEKK